MDPAFVEQHPTIIETAEELKSWDWTFGQTPEFSIKDGIVLGLFEDDSEDKYTLGFTCKYGRLTQITLEPLTNHAASSEAHTRAYTTALSQALSHHLKGHKLHQESLHACKLLGPPEVPAFKPIPKATWFVLMDRLITLASF